MANEREVGPAYLIANILEKYLGKVETLSDQLALSNGYGKIQRIDYSDIGSDLCRIVVEKKFWNTKEVEGQLDSFLAGVSDLLEIYYRIPTTVLVSMESGFRENILTFNKRRKLYNRDFVEVDPGTIRHLLEMLFTNLCPLDGVNVIKKAKNANAPKKSIKRRQSYEKFRKILLIENLRFLWKLRTGQMAPRSIPYEGNSFGDMVAEIFTALEIEADVRAAMDAWRHELDT